MGARYGRNQKRRHRKRIAELEASLEAEAQRAGLLRGAVADLTHKLDAVFDRIKAACPHSVVLPPRELRHDPYEWNVAAYREVGITEFMIERDVGPEPLPYLRTSLGKVLVYVEDVVREPGFRTAVHFRVPARDGALHYSVAVPQVDLRHPGMVEQVISDAVEAIQSHLRKESA